MNPRLRRLQADYELVRELYSGHPHVSIEPLGFRLPPESYRVTFRVRGLFLNGEQPDYRDVHHVEMMLPRRYPAERPYVVPTEPIFHPNIRDYFCIADYWAAGTTLADVVAKLGDMIQWRIYNVASPLDAIAARWAAEQEPSGLFPIGNVDLGVADFDITVRSRDSLAAPMLAPLVDGPIAAGDGVPRDEVPRDEAPRDGVPRDEAAYDHATRDDVGRLPLRSVSADGDGDDDGVVVLLRNRDGG